MDSELEKKLIDAMSVIMEQKIMELRSSLTIQITNDVMNKMKGEVNAAVDEKIEKAGSLALVTADVPQQLQSAIIMATEQIGSSVYKQVIDEINEKVVPQVNGMVEWVNYNLQDGGEVVDQYRRAAEMQANKIDPSVKLLTFGATDKRIISEHVRTFFGGPDEDSSED